MDAAHWEQVYRTKRPDEVSWFRPHLARSLELILAACPDRQSSIIDVGGGESTLVDDLLESGYKRVTVLDISKTALDATRTRLGAAVEGVQWICADITSVALPSAAFDLWHDRAVFHFLVSPEDRQAYVRAAMHSIKPGGHMIVSTFGPEGPIKCSGLPTMRYDAESLRREFGAGFQLLESSLELHETPFGTTQQFLYTHFQLISQ